MKTNLSTFPTEAPFRIDKLEFANNYIKEMWKWKENFTKELQQLVQELDPNKDLPSSQLDISILKEILGQ